MGCQNDLKWAINGQISMPKVPRHLHQVNCFQEGMLELDSPMGQCYSRFPTVSSGRRGDKRKKDTGFPFIPSLWMPWNFRH